MHGLWQAVTCTVRVVTCPVKVATCVSVRCCASARAISRASVRCCASAKVVTCPVKVATCVSVRCCASARAISRASVRCCASASAMNCCSPARSSASCSGGAELVSQHQATQLSAPFGSCLRRMKSWKSSTVKGILVLAMRSPWRPGKILRALWEKRIANYKADALGMQIPRRCGPLS